MANEIDTLGALCYRTSSGKLAFSTKYDTYGSLTYKDRLCMSLLFNHTVTTTQWEITVKFNPGAAKSAEDVGNITEPPDTQYWGVADHKTNYFYYSVNNVTVESQVKPMPSTTTVETRENLLVSRSLRASSSDAFVRDNANTYYAVTAATLDQPPEDITYDALDSLEKRIVDDELTEDELKEVTNGTVHYYESTGQTVAYIYRDASGYITTISYIDEAGTKTWYEGDADITKLRERKLVFPFTSIEPAIVDLINTDNNTDLTNVIEKSGNISLSTRVTDTLYMYKYTTSLKLNVISSKESEAKWEQTRTPTLTADWTDKYIENTTIKKSITEIADMLRSLGASQFSLPNPSLSYYTYTEQKEGEPKLVWSYKFINGSPVDNKGNYYERVLCFYSKPGRYTSGKPHLNVSNISSTKTINNNKYAYNSSLRKHEISVSLNFTGAYTSDYKDYGTPKDYIQIDMNDVCYRLPTQPTNQRSR